MLNALYSVLSSDPEFTKDTGLIKALLSKGIKILVFADEATCGTLEASKENEKYISARLLQIYMLRKPSPIITLIDGHTDSEEQESLETLGKLCPDFNYEQFTIEHCSANENMIVEAGAGTGKTTVMIDRIMFLLHTVPDLLPEDIGMITFTNEATQHMKDKIQQELIRRFEVTGQIKYVLLLEHSASIRIQTIDSFSKDFVSEFGSSIGYGSSVSVRGFKHEKDIIIRDVLDDYYSGKSGSVQNSLGLRLHDLEKLIYDFWERLSQAGLADESIATLDWGMSADSDSDALQETLKSIFAEICDRYNRLKKQTDSIAVNDIVRELDRILFAGNELVQKSHHFRYLFVDEFQDSDNSQIRSIAWLQKNGNLRLFVVGDVKQSIYRFRGAVDTAFTKLEEELDEYKTFSLVRNYRTSADILKQIDHVFRSWEQRGIFDYGVTLQAQKKHAGKFHTRKILKKKTVIESEFINLVRDCLKDCARDAKNKGSSLEKTQRVTVLTRTNFQLDTIAEWCEKASIPCYIQTEGTFYQSPAVLDFFTMIKAYTFPSDIAGLVDYALSAYSSSTFDTVIFEKKAGSVEQHRAITNLLEANNWTDNLKSFRLKPVMAVINEITNAANPAERFAEIRRAVLEKNGTWKEENLEAQVKAEVLQYKADTDKLLTVLRSHFSGQMSDLYGLFNFLKLNIATNHNEDEPDISESVGINAVYGLTVHKAKGLEFDTVIIPFTYREYRHEADTEILLDETANPCRAGWSSVVWKDQYHSEVESQKMNTYYTDCVSKEFRDVDREEARLLYVAMTRSIRRLECFVTDPKPHNWAGLLG